VKSLKYFFLSILILVGALLIPAKSSACAKKVNVFHSPISKVEHCIKNRISDVKHSHSCTKDKCKGCSNECKHSSCKCSSTSNHFSLSDHSQLDMEINHVAADKKRNPLRSTQLFPGFYSIWTPPNI